MVHRVIVEDQSLRWYGRPPKIADDSIEFVRFQFHLPEDWDPLVLVAQFTQADTYNMLLDKDTCFLPKELTAGLCKLSLFGYTEGRPLRATSTPLVFQIEESGFVSSAETPIPPTPDLYAQLIEYFSSIAGSGGTINPEDIAAAVEDYLSKNPPEPGAPGEPGEPGEDGGYYTPGVSQSDADSVQFSFTGSKPDMPVVPSVSVPLPKPEVILELDNTLTQSGKAADAKATGDALNKKLSADMLTEAVNDALSQAKESGLFDGPQGEQGPQGIPGNDYVLTDADKDYLVEQVKAPVEEFARQAGIAYSNALVAETGAKNAEANAKTQADNASASEGRAKDQANLSYQNARAAGEYRDQAAASAAAAEASAAEAKEAAGSAAIVPKPTAAVAGKALIVNTAGTGYEFGNAPGGGGSGEPAVPSDWNAAEGQPGHILNRTHWVEENGIVEVLPECQPVFDAGAFGVMGEVPLSVGEEYTVRWNGVDYSCIAKSAELDGLVAAGLGNLAAMGVGEETNDPFAIVGVPGELVGLPGGFAAEIMPLDGTTELTVSITTVGEVIHKLDEKFLPMDKLRDVVVFEFDDYPYHTEQVPQYSQIEKALLSGKDVILSFRNGEEWYRSCGIGPANLYFFRAYEGSIESLGISRSTGLVTYNPKPIPDDYYINRLIDAKLGVIENGTY